MRRWVIAASAVSVALLTVPSVASADPVVPQSDTPCTANFANAMTWPADQKAPLVCANQPSGYEWKTVTDPYPVSDRWLSYGPPMKLHGQGLRNPSIMSGDWVATPQDPGTQCRAEQLAVVRAGEVGPPQVSQAAQGQPLSLQVVPQLFSITMTGYCLWAKAGS